MILWKKRPQRRVGLFLIGNLLLVFLSLSAAQAQTTPSKPNGKWMFFGSWRLRPEVWSWFGTPAGEDSYTYIGSLLRLGVSRQTSREDLTLELAQPTLINLPAGGALPAPQGLLGLGPTYRSANGNQSASLFLKQGFLRLKNVGAPQNALRLGRFEFNDGQETVPTDAALAWVKQQRISQRLIGAFGWTHIGRSFDGLHFTRTSPKHQVTVLAAFPTQGVFDLDGMETLTGARLGYFGYTWPQLGGSKQQEARLFGIYYEDARAITKVDNRPAAARAADGRTIRMGTFGGHYLRAWDVAGGKVDAMAWGAFQLGQWGALEQAASAYTLEAGYQPKNMAWSPWIRGGFFQGSGDGNPDNNRHGTFIPLLPTPRPYAQFPFYNESNVNDAFLQLLLRPNKKTTVRLEGHRLWLADAKDLWYLSGGPFQPRPTFGYVGRPSGGNRDLATLVDVSVDTKWTPALSTNLYFGYALGGSVARSIYPGRNASLGYAELNYRW